MSAEEEASTEPVCFASFVFTTLHLTHIHNLIEFKAKKNRRRSNRCSHCSEANVKWARKSNSASIFALVSAAVESETDFLRKIGQAIRCRDGTIVGFRIEVSCQESI
eukprot:SAG31_NODE_532_length_14374_cov_30.565254_3_plen_107_part_00